MINFRGYERYNFTADIYDYEIANDANGTLLYSYRETVAVRFGNDRNAPRINITCDKPIRKLAQIANVRNGDGTEVLPGAVWSITKTDVLTNMFGKVINYRMAGALQNSPNFEV